MGMAEIAKELRIQRNEKAGRRLFQYIQETQEIKEKPPLKVGDSFRASSLPYLCPREEVLASKYDVIRAEIIPPSLHITYQIGHLFHDLYRDFYFGPGQEWVGAWECVRCGWNTDKAGLSKCPGKRRKGKLATMPSECGGCGAPFIRQKGMSEQTRLCGTFMEWLVHDDKLGLHGHPDGWSRRVDVPRVLVDLKSHGFTGFLTRKAIRDGHDLQVWAYQYMCGDRNGEVWYMNKSPWGDSSAFLRDIVVPYSKEQFRDLIRKPLDQMHDGIAGGKLPERKCVHPDSVNASVCQLVDVCFE